LVESQDVKSRLLT